MLSHLASALFALGEKMRMQSETAVHVCALGARAEEIARTARHMAFDHHGKPQDRVRALSGDLDAFATELLDIAERVERDALLGRAVAEALNRHSTDLDALAQDSIQAQDPAAVRARLQPLAATLQELPTQMRARKERSAELTVLAGRAREVADQAAGLLASGAPGRQEQMLALSRGLGQLAADAVEISAQFSADATMAARVAEGMARRTQTMFGAGRSDAASTALSHVISTGQAMARSVPEEPPAGRSSGQAVVWNIGGRRV